MLVMILNWPLYVLSSRFDTPERATREYWGGEVDHWKFEHYKVKHFKLTKLHIVCYEVRILKFINLPIRV